MLVNRLAALPAGSARAVVINVGTDLLATQAIASAIECAAMPVLLVNCDPTPTSTTLFRELSEEQQFDVIEAPRRTHGQTLDWLFRELESELVLLLDSDAEIRSSAYVDRMQSSFANERVFGAGFVEGPRWLTSRFGGPPQPSLFQERPWVPCVMLRTTHVRRALEAGASFEIRAIFNDFMWSERVSRLLAKRFSDASDARSRVIARLPERVRSWMSAQTLPALRWARRDFYGHRPNYVHCDTGADVYQWCKYHAGLVFAGMSSDLRTRDDVVHYKGATRRTLGYGSPGIRPIDDLENVVIERLRTRYSIDWDDRVNRACNR